MKSILTIYHLNPCNRQNYSYALRRTFGRVCLKLEVHSALVAMRSDSGLQTKRVASLQFHFVNYVNGDDICIRRNESDWNTLHHLLEYSLFTFVCTQTLPIKFHEIFVSIKFLKFLQIGLLIADEFNCIRGKNWIVGVMPGFIIEVERLMVTVVIGDMELQRIRCWTSVICPAQYRSSSGQ